MTWIGGRVDVHIGSELSQRWAEALRAVHTQSPKGGGSDTREQLMLKPLGPRLT